MRNFVDFIVDHLDDIASLVTALSAVSAAIAYFRSRYIKQNRIKRLEQFLQQEGRKRGGRLIMSVEDIVATHQMMPDEVLEAIRESGNLLTRLDGPGSDLWSRLKVTYMTSEQLRRTQVDS